MVNQTPSAGFRVAIRMGRAQWKDPQYTVIRLLSRINLPLFICLLAAIMIAAFFGTQISGRVVSVLAASLGDRLDEILQRRVIQEVNGLLASGISMIQLLRNSVAQVAGMGVTTYTPGGAAIGMTTRAVYTLQTHEATAILPNYRW
jgi:hypothetical protein